MAGDHDPTQPIEPIDRTPDARSATDAAPADPGDARRDAADGAEASADEVAALIADEMRAAGSIQTAETTSAQPADEPASEPAQKLDAAASETDEGGSDDPPGPSLGARTLIALRSPRGKRVLVAAGFIGFVLVCSLVLIVTALTRAEPSWWGTLDANDPQVKLKAEQIENGVTSLLSDPRPPNKSRDPRDPWTVRLSATDANAWLNARLRQWLNTQEDIGFKWPEQVDELRVRFEGGRISVGARVNQNGASQIFTATLRPRFERDGALWMPAERIALGRLGLPASWVLPSAEEGPTEAADSPVVERMGEVSEEIAELPQTRQVLAALAGENAVLSNPIVKLPDGRRVKLLGLQAHNEKLYITCQTIIRDTTTTRADGRDARGEGPPGSVPPPARTSHVP